MELDCILCRQDTRTVDNASTFSFGGSSYRITQERKTLSLPARSVVTVGTSPRFGVKVLYQGSWYEVEVLEEVPKKPMAPQPVKKNP